MINTATEKVRKYEVLKSNVDEYLDRNIEILEANVEQAEGDFPLVDIILETGDVIRSTSKVLAKQISREKERGFPIACQITKIKGKYPYYCLVAPK